MARVRNQDGCEVNMTPMIDVVFQLIIFFVVMVTLSTDRNEDIKLVWTPNSPEIKNEPNTKDIAEQMTLTIEVDKKGRVSIANRPLSYTQLQEMVKRRRIRFNNNPPPIQIRADIQTQHMYLKPVLDICAAQGQGRVSFVGIKRTKDTKN